VIAFMRNPPFPPSGRSSGVFPYGAVPQPASSRGIRHSCSGCLFPHHHRPSRNRSANRRARLSFAGLVATGSVSCLGKHPVCHFLPGYVKRVSPVHKAGGIVPRIIFLAKRVGQRVEASFSWLLSGGLHRTTAL
jgi:hypothetical protein